MSFTAVVPVAVGVVPMSSVSSGANLSHDIYNFGYLRTEFPSECWDFPTVANTVTHSLAQLFVKLLPADRRLERVYWFSEDDVLKVWTIIAEADFALEEPIYEAQMLFMEKFQEFECDFSVIYRYGQSLSMIEPQGARQVL